MFHRVEPTLSLGFHTLKVSSIVMTVNLLAGPLSPSLTPIIMDRIYIVNVSEVKSVVISTRNADASSATPPNLKTLHLETNWKRVQRK